MASGAAVAGTIRFGPMRVADTVPPFDTRSYRLFSFLWSLALLLAVVGPLMGLYQRYTDPGDNSQLLLGSRAGIAVSPDDATRIRFPVGPYAKAAGIRSGDDLVAVFGIPLPDKMPVTAEALASHADDPAYIVMSNLLFGSEAADVPLTIRSPDGQLREVTVATGEQHIDAAVENHGIPAGWLGFVDLVHVLFYPFLLWAAWILHRRNPRDAVSSILSLAILLLIGSEQPASGFLAASGIPRWANAAAYDLGNICLLAGILLFPHGKLSIRAIVLVAALPILFLLHGTAYQMAFVAFMIAAVAMLVGCLRKAVSEDLRQQIQWALFGFSGYALFRILSIVADLTKTSTGSFGAQISLELFAGFALGLAMLLLQLGLLVALLRYRLYDAESIISRTATAAILTLGIGGVFAGVMEGLITGVQFLYPNSNTGQGIAAMGGAIAAAVVLEPLRDRTREWAERRFHKSLIAVREGLPDLIRDLRDFVSVDDLLHEILQRLLEDTHSSSAAVIVGNGVRQSIGIEPAQAEAWLASFDPSGSERVQCDPEDRTFPLRVRLETSTGAGLGWLVLGPRPDSSIAGKDEQHALGDAAPELARALRIAIKREQEELATAAIISSHQERIERIESLLGELGGRFDRIRIKE